MPFGVIGEEKVYKSADELIEMIREGMKALEVEETERMVQAAIAAYNKNLPQDKIIEYNIQVRQPYSSVQVFGGGRAGVGFSKCAPCDEWDVITGVHLALRRAIDEYHTIFVPDVVSSVDL